MAIVLVKSTIITNLDSSPPIKNPSWLAEGVIREQVAQYLLVNGDSIASIYRMCRVHSSERVTNLLIYCDAIATAVGDIGLYDTQANGSAVVDVDFFATAQAFTAVLNGTDVQWEAAAGVTVISNISKRMWEVLGLAADPNKFYDIAITLTAAAGAGGTIAMKLRSVRPSA